MSTQLRAQATATSRPTPSYTPVQTGLLQRKCACGGTPGLDGECAECRKKQPALHRRSDGRAGPNVVPSIVHEALRSPGQPLDPAARAFMEPRFGHDFSRVRVHTDAQAAESAWAVNARAYTAGHDVVFGGGQYAAGTTAGRRLLAHELTHVVQQSDGQVGGAAIVRDAALEGEADRQGDRVAQGESAHEDFSLGRSDHATEGSPAGAFLNLPGLGNPLAAGTIHAKTIQLDEESDEGGTGEAVDCEGGPCLRLWVPFYGGKGQLVRH